MASSTVGVKPGGDSWMAHTSSEKVTLNAGSSTDHAPIRLSRPAMCRSVRPWLRLVSAASCAGVAVLSLIRYEARPPLSHARTRVQFCAMPEVLADHSLSLTLIGLCPRLHTGAEALPALRRTRSLPRLEEIAAGRQNEGLRREAAGTLHIRGCDGGFTRWSLAALTLLELRR